MPPPQGPSGPRIAPQNDIYTVLLATAAGLLFFAIIVLAVRSHQLFGSVFPAGGG